jgi:CPA2 family monovalent cation:H+ antiporter-2
MDHGSVLIDVLILLGAALLLGTLAERLRQSAIVGYLLAGAIVGPKVLRLVGQRADVQLMAELGVALLLFTIGLEFSFRRLRRLGTVALAGGALQIIVTCVLAAIAAAALGLGFRAAIALGAMLALSSTATVLRLLRDRAAVESPYGRNAMGILLLQDVAVLPLTLLISAMTMGDRVADALWATGKALLFGAIMVGVFLGLFNYIVPRLLNIRQWAINREFPILLAIVLAIGSATAAQHLSISPAIGAFLAGVLLAESPFAVQIRADIASLRTLLVTLFFASVGMLTDPVWVARHWYVVLGAVSVVVVGKAAIVGLILVLLRVPAGMSLATGLCLAQVGEFSFVLAQTAMGQRPGSAIIDEQTLRLIVSVTVITLFLTPYLVSAAPNAAGLLEGWLMRRRRGEKQPVTPTSQGAPAPARSIILIGFGPAGQRIAEALLTRHQQDLFVIDLNPRAAAVAQRYGLPILAGNASQPEVLESARIHQARVIVVTVPDPAASRQVIQLCRHMNPNASVLVRARYHVFRWELELAGAEVVIDEEEQVGLRLAAEVRRILHTQGEGSAAE